eukprot:Clim_evm14s84 gene=Clim_evmTU14s84
MHLEEVVIDGFKSYARRVQVGKFDRHFNAITGFNGSGKSNILDSICFVLGISNMGSIRASSMNDLVYKQGQAGVNKASVTLVFNNTDKESSHPGYRDYDQIQVTRTVMIGGKNKYMINGRVVQKNQIENLFQGVQLNVNNPNFLIMQGTITKVLNMKPIEILSKVEEAAGTGMFEKKRELALNTMEKKQKKLEEIRRLLEEEILPKLNRLQQEKHDYQEFQANQKEITRLQSVVVSYAYLTKTKELSSKLEEIDQSKSRRDQITREIADAETVVADLATQIKAAEQKRDMESGGELKDAESAVESAGRKLVEAKTAADQGAKDLDEERKNLTKVIAALEEVHQKQKEKSDAIDTTTEQSRTKDAENLAKVEKYERLQQQYRSATVGVDEAGKGKTMMAELMEAKSRVADLETSMVRTEQKATRAKKALEKAQKKAGASSKKLDKVRTAIAKREEDIKALQAEVDGLSQAQSQSQQDHNAVDVRALQRQRTQKTTELEAIQERMETLNSRLRAIQFEYKDPERGFDRSRVKGRAAQLVTVQSKEHNLALEIAAGGRLYNVIVDTVDTGKKLLKHGQLKKRVTIIPLDDVAKRSLSAKQIAVAEQEVGKENIHTALSLVGYDAELEPAMQFIFGTTLVARDMNAAQRVAFHPQVMARTVTLDGEEFDPSGTLTGGSAPGGSGMLSCLADLQSEQAHLAIVQQALQKIEDSLNAAEEGSAALEAAQDRLSAAQDELTRLQAELAGSADNAVLQEVEDLQRAIDDDQAALARDAELLAQAKDEVTATQERIDAMSGSREETLAQLKKDVAAAKKEADKSQKELKVARDQLNEMKLELETLRTDELATEEDVQKGKDMVAETEKRHAGLLEAVETCQEDLETKEQILTDLRAKTAAMDDEIQKLQQESHRRSKQQDKDRHTLEKLHEQIKENERHQKDLQSTARELESKHPWVVEDLPLFGQEGSDYDYTRYNPKQASKRLRALEEKQRHLEGKINRSVYATLEKTEKECRELKSRYAKVQEDKEKIEHAIEDLNRKKRDAVERTQTTVSKDFGSIMESLLPGVTAALMPPEGSTSAMDGLEFRVAFNGKWKESLTELSGGQRSLVALSFILALLRFNPAPVYILDEVDAALDLSHTQNIGRMLKRHFSNSQFVVVSLKEGMFNHANVLFRTKLVNGVSTVARHAAASSAASSPATKENLDLVGSGKGATHAAKRRQRQPLGTAN